MAGRGPQSFKKRQKEQQRKEKQQEKFAKRLERRRQGANASAGVDETGPSPVTEEGREIPAPFPSEH